MIDVQTIKYAIILAVLILFAGLLWKWHNDGLDQATRIQIAKTEVVIEQLNHELIKYMAEGVRLKKTADSAIASIHPQDTVFVRIKGDKAIYAVRNLETDASIEYLRNRVK